jgi:hypothetical protein
MIQALKEYSQYYQRLENFPIKWNTKQQELFVVTNFRQLLLWHLNIWVVVVLFEGMSLVLIYLQQIFQPDPTLPLFKILVHGVFFCLYITVAGISVIFNFWNREIVAGWNQLKEIYKQIQ